MHNLSCENEFYYEHLTSFSCRGPGELGNGLLSYLFWCKVPAVSREPSPQTKYTPSPPMTENPSPRALLLTIQFSLGGTILTCSALSLKTLIKVSKAPSPPLYFFLHRAGSLPLCAGLSVSPLHLFRLPKLNMGCASVQAKTQWALFIKFRQTLIRLYVD